MSCNDRVQVFHRMSAESMGLTSHTARQVCESKGVGYYYNIRDSSASYDVPHECWGPCDAACMSDVQEFPDWTPEELARGNLSSLERYGKGFSKKCNPRPLLTAVDIYYQVLQDAAASCMDKSEAYKRAVEENGGDPSKIGFNSDCPNPYAPANPPQSDPLNDGSSGVFDPAASNGDPTKPADAPPFNAGEPYIPPPPPSYKTYAGISSDTSPADPNLPTERITLTDDDIAQFPKVNDYGTMREDTFAQTCRIEPTYVDTHPEHLTDCETYIKDFVWSCVPTQEQFDKLPDDLKCTLATQYFTIYDKPELIGKMREHAGSITITRNSPPVAAPVYKQNLEQEHREKCEAQKNEDGVSCSYSGGCNGRCVCPEPSCKHVDMGTNLDGRTLSYKDCGGRILCDADSGSVGTKSDFQSLGPGPISRVLQAEDPSKCGSATGLDGGRSRVSDDGGSNWFFDNILLIGGGVAVVGVFGYGYYIYSKASYTASAVGNFGTSLAGVGIGGFKLVPT